MADVLSAFRPAAAGILEGAFFFLMIRRQKYTGKPKFFVFAILGVCLLFAFLQIEILHQFLDLFLRLAVCVPLLYFLYHIPLRRSFFLALVFYLAISVCKSLLARPILLGFGFDLTVFTSASPANSWIWAFFTALLECGAVLLIRRFLSTEKSQDIPAVQLLIALISCVIYMLMRQLLRNYSRLNLSLGSPDITLAMLALCIATLALALFSENYFLSSRRKSEIEKLEKLLDLQCKNYLQRNEAEDRVREMYHDIKHHLQCIQNITTNSEVRAYAQSIQSRISQYGQFFHTGNRIFDIVLHEKTVQAEQDGIQLQVYTAFDSLDFLEPADLCAIFSNALDNALEAAAQISGERVVQVRVTTLAGCIAICIENPFVGELHKKGDRLLTKKADSTAHGYGLLSIAHSVEKYGGDFSIRTEDGKFTLSIAIPHPRLSS